MTSIALASLDGHLRRRSRTSLSQKPLQVNLADGLDNLLLSRPVRSPLLTSEVRARSSRFMCFWSPVVGLRNYVDLQN